MTQSTFPFSTEEDVHADEVDGQRSKRAAIIITRRSRRSLQAAA